MIHDFAARAARSTKLHQVYPLILRPMGTPLEYVLSQQPHSLGKESRGILIYGHCPSLSLHKSTTLWECGRWDRLLFRLMEAPLLALSQLSRTTSNQKYWGTEKSESPKLGVFALKLSSFRPSSPFVIGQFSLCAGHHKAQEGLFALTSQ